MFVLTKLDLVQPNAAGQVAGFDLDGIESDGKAVDDCRVRDFVSPDSVPGIDNRLSHLLANTTTQINESVPALIQDAIKSGGLLLIGELVGADNFVNDETVGFVVRRSIDVPLLGTDSRILDSQTFELAFDHYVGSAPDGKIVNGRFLAGPLEMRIRVTILGRVIFAKFRNVHVDLELNDRGDVVSGIIGGGFHTEDVYGVADSIEAQDKNESTIPLIRAIIPPLADVKSKDSGKCDQISFGLETAAVRAFVFEPLKSENPYKTTTGAEIFSAHGCIGCHTVAAIPEARQTVGPKLDGLGARIANRPSPENYVRQSIANPNGHLVSGYEPGIMPRNLRDRLTSYEFDTLVAWLLTL
ncbi:MAG: c-type cytochrome [Burkholderiales bacterium]|nr:c-type cytochrome [Burkholderiales bacterium]